MTSLQQNASFTTGALGSASQVLSGSAYTPTTQSSSSEVSPELMDQFDEVWADNLRDRYGISQPFAEEDE